MGVGVLLVELRFSPFVLCEAFRIRALAALVLGHAALIFRKPALVFSTSLVELRPRSIQLRARSIELRLGVGKLRVSALALRIELSLRSVKLGGPLLDLGYLARKRLVLRGGCRVRFARGVKLRHLRLKPGERSAERIELGESLLDCRALCVYLGLGVGELGVRGRTLAFKLRRASAPCVFRRRKLRFGRRNGRSSIAKLRSRAFQARQRRAQLALGVVQLRLGVVKLGLGVVKLGLCVGTLCLVFGAGVVELLLRFGLKALEPFGRNVGNSGFHPLFDRRHDVVVRLAGRVRFAGAFDRNERLRGRIVLCERPFRHIGVLFYAAASQRRRAQGREADVRRRANRADHGKLTRGQDIVQVGIAFKAGDSLPYRDLAVGDRVFGHYAFARLRRPLPLHQNKAVEVLFIVGNGRNAI